MITGSLEDLRREAAPATLFVGESLLANCWPRAFRMVTLWEELRAGAIAPQRTAFSPKNIGEDITLMAFFDLEPTSHRLKCRMMGSTFSDAVGNDATGTYMDEQGQTGQAVRRALWVLNAATPLLVKDIRLVWSPQKSYKSYDSLILPFVGENDRVASIAYLNQFRSM